MSAAVENKKRKMSLSAKIILGVGSFLLVATIAVGTVLMVKSVNSMKDLLQGKMIDIANSAATMLNGDELKDLTINDLGGEIYFYDEEMALPEDERHHALDGVVVTSTDSAYTILSSLEDGERTKTKYEITGVVHSVLVANSLVHNSISFTFGETETSTNLLSIFDFELEDESRYPDIKKGTKLIISGFLEKRVNEDSSITPTFAYATNLYEKYLGILAEFRTSNERSNAEFAYIYTIRRVEGRYVFSLDPSDEPGGFFTEETIVTSSLIRAFNEGIPTVDEESFTDRWGKYYTAYSPVFDSNRNVISVVAVDISASWYDKVIASDAIAIAIVGVSTIVVGILLALVVTSSIRKKFEVVSLEMSELEGDVKNLIRDINASEEIYAENIEGSDLGTLRERVQKTQTELKKYIKYVKEQAYIDGLTKLGNRTAYFERVSYLNKDFSRNFTVAVFDINGLKQINDNFGHEAGDMSIIGTAQVLSSIFGTQSCFRIGGDEFVVIIDYSNKDKIKEAFEKLRVAFKEHKEAHTEYPFDLSISFGYAPVNFEEDKEFMDVFRRADKEMYIAKKEFHNNDDK